MKELLLMPMAMAAAVSAFAADPDPVVWDWSKKTDGTSILNASDFCNPANWEGGKMPGEGDVAQFTYPAAVRYVKADREVTFFRLTCPTTFDYWSDTSPRTVLVSDHPVNVTGHDAPQRIQLYADVTCPVYTDRMILCGDWLSPNFSLNESFYHRLDLYANEAGGTRVNPGPTNTMSTSYSPYYLFAPRGTKTPIVSTFTATERSPYLSPTDATIGTKLPVGTIVTAGDSLPAGTFLKRIFPDGKIELSNPVGASGDLSLTFAPLTVKVYQYSRTNTGGNGSVYPLKYSEDDEIVWELGRATTTGTQLRFGTAGGLLPGTVRLHDATRSGILFNLGTCHLEFCETTATGGPGFPNSPAFQPDANARTRFTVTNNIVAAINAFSNVVGQVTKDGAGTLRLGMNCANKQTANTGSLTISEGTVEVADGSCLASVSVAAGATLKLDGDFSATTIVFEKGASVSGTGTLNVTSADTLANATFAPGVSVRLVGGSGLIYDNPPAGTRDTVTALKPAFWIDARTSPMVTSEVNGKTYVSRLDDVRKTSDDDGYMFATAVSASALPEIVTNKDGTVAHLYVYHKVADFADVCDLKWSVPLTDIRSLFLVQNVDNSQGGGQLLGQTPTLENSLVASERSPFLRNPGDGWAREIVYSVSPSAGSARDRVLKGLFFQNGERSSTSDHYAFNAGQDALSKMWHPLTVDLHLSQGVAADCFSYQSGGAKDRNGYKRMCEMLVFTNDLTAAERLSVRQYLMRKWQNCDAPYGRCDANAVRNLTVEQGLVLAPAAGETAYVGGLSGEGTFEKRGAGSLTVDGLADARADLHVAGGTLRIRSRTVDASVIPDDVFLHLDATRTDTMDFADQEKTQLKSWASANGNGRKLSLWSSASEYKPVWKAGQMNGLPLVDFGDPKSHWVKDPSTGVIDTYPQSAFSGMSISGGGSYFLHTLVMVQNTSKSGGSIADACTSWSNDGLFRKGWGSTYNNVPPITYENGILGGGQGGQYAYLDAEIGSRGRLNGVDTDLVRSGFTGGDDLLSFVGYLNFHASHFSINTGYGYAGGGQILGEYILCERGMSPLEIADIEAYLNKKWKGIDTPGYLPAVAGDVTVDAGSTLEVYGGLPLTVKSLGGAGTVAGDVSFADAPSFFVELNQDGSVPTLVLPDAIDLGSGGTVTLVGEGWDDLLPGDYAIVTSAAFRTGATAWTLANAPVKRVCTVRVENGRLVLSCQKRGSVLIVR